MESERQYIHQDARSVEIRAAISASTELRQERWAHHVWRHVQWFSQTRYCASRLVHLHVCYALYAFAGAVAINSLIDTGLLVLVMHYIKRKAIPSLVSVLAGATTLGLILYAMNVLVYLTMMTPRFEAGYSNLLSAGQFAKWLILVGVSVCLVRALWVGLEHRRRWIRLLAVSTAAVCAAVLLSPSVSSIGLWFGQLFKAARLDPSPAIPARQPWLLVNLPWVAAACGLLPTALTMLFATVAGALHLSLRAGHRVVAAAFLFCTRYMGGSIGVIVTLGSVLLWSIAKLIR